MTVSTTRVAMAVAFEFIISNGGIDTEKDYPYTGYDGRCDTDRVGVSVISYYVCGEHYHLTIHNVDWHCQIFF